MVKPGQSVHFSQRCSGRNCLFPCFSTGCSQSCRPEPGGSPPSRICQGFYRLSVRVFPFFLHCHLFLPIGHRRENPQKRPTGHFSPAAGDPRIRFFPARIPAAPQRQIFGKSPPGGALSRLFRFCPGDASFPPSLVNRTIFAGKYPPRAL